MYITVLRLEFFSVYICLCYFLQSAEEMNKTIITKKLKDLSFVLYFYNEIFVFVISLRCNLQIQSPINIVMQVSLVKITGFLNDRYW